MIDGILAGLRIIEGSAFVAIPLGGMTLAQLGADVIRFDPIGGGLDAKRWPLDRQGNSLFWAGLNKGKRSIAVDLRSPEGRDVVATLIAGAGNFITNLPDAGWLSYETLSKRRDDLIMVAMSGNRDGSSAIDYTVNAATGYPLVTGPPGSDEPVNSVLPAWDIAAGLHAVVGLLAAERYRARTGRGSLVRVALSDVAFALTAGLGRLAQGELGLDDGGKQGNFLYGAFGRDFVTSDGRRVMVVALTPKQWIALRSTTGLDAEVAALAERTGLDLDTPDGRFAARDELAALLAPWFARRTFAEVESAFADSGVSFGPYRTFRELATEDPRVIGPDSLFAPVAHAGGAVYRTPASPIDFDSVARLPPLPAPSLGQHTDEILAEVLGLPDHEIGRLHDNRIVAGPRK
ncbi:MAG TPA: CoA transferase [Bauldia sp.]|nr:CoA transferase [Bauldia sp.]